LAHPVYEHGDVMFVQVSLTNRVHWMKSNSAIYSVEGFDLFVIVKAPSLPPGTGTCSCRPVCLLCADL